MRALSAALSEHRLRVSHLAFLAADDVKRWCGRTAPTAMPKYIMAMESESSEVIYFETDCFGFPLCLPVILAEARQTGRGTVMVARTPYGTLSPLAPRRLKRETVQQLLEVVRTRLADLGVASLFVAVDASQVGDEVWFRPPLETEVRRTQVVVPILGDPDQQWMQYEHKVRKNVKRARRDGVEVEVTNGLDSDLDAFFDIYAKTMERRDASDRYRFPELELRDMIRSAPEDFIVATAYLRGRAVSSEVCVKDGERIFSFLGGTSKEFFRSRPNDLLKHSIIEWGRQRGISEFVLGGGKEPNDGIYRYKRSFAPDGVRPFYGVKAIASHQAHFDALGCWLDNNDSTTIASVLTEGRWPPYG